MEQRLQRVLAAAGIASRRKAEEYITAGRVRVNGEPVTAQGTNVDPDTDVITVDGETISVNAKRYYVALNKPLGYVSTVSDPFAEKKVVDLVKIPGSRLVPVGRLDADSEGLILLSDDGDFVFKVTHPTQSMGKTYVVTVKGKPTVDAIKRISKGLKLADNYTTAPAKVTDLGRGNEPGSTVLELVLHEGKYRQVRRMLDAIGHPVLRLVRTRVGPVSIGVLQPGEWRNLTPSEVRLIEEGKNAPEAEPDAQQRFGQRGHYDGERREPQRERVYLQGGRPSAGRPSGRPAPRPGFGGDRPRPSFGGDRPRPSFNDRPGGDRPRPSFGGDRGNDRPRPSYGGDRPSFSSGGDRPRPSYGGGGDRSGGNDRPRPQGDRRFDAPRRAMGQNENGGGADRPRPSFGGGDRPSYGGGRPPQGGGGSRFGGDRPGGGDRPRPQGDRPSYGGDRPRPSFGGDRPRPSYGGGDRPGFGGGRPPQGGGFRGGSGGGGNAPRRPFNNGGGGQGGGSRPPYRPTQKPRD